MTAVYLQVMEAIPSIYICAGCRDTLGRSSSGYSTGYVVRFVATAHL